MGNKVIVLDKGTISKIAAGEVIERPSSIIKELVENAIDASGTRIEIEIKNAGKDFIRVSDNGIGMGYTDAELAFSRHATSKIKKIKDLASIKTLGFRGEALPSIASVSKVEIITKREEDLLGTRILVSNNKILSKEKIGSPDGTVIKVKNLFDNVPARKKFLKSNTYESGLISDMVTRIALVNPHISFKFISEGRAIFNTYGSNNLFDTIASIYGNEVAENLIEVKIRNEEFSLIGYISHPQLTRSNRNYQTFSVNNRYVKEHVLQKAVEDSYKTLLPINRYPLIVLNLDLPGENIDINVHPSKMEIRFNQEKRIYNFVYKEIHNVLNRTVNIPKIVKREQNEKENQNNKQLVIKEELHKTMEYKPNFSENIIEESTITKYIDNTKEKEFIPDIKQVKLATLIPLGQLFSTYILAQSKDEFFVIDQHAAHERIIYENLVEKYKDKLIYKQELIAPLVFELSYQEKNILLENLELIDGLGFDIEDFGDNTILVRTVPITLKNSVGKDFFIDMADKLSSFSPYKDKKEKDLIIMISCKGAIKANDRLTEIESRKLLEELERTAYPYTCPHGRPTIISMSKYELEKKFKRK